MMIRLGFTLLFQIAIHLIIWIVLYAYAEWISCATAIWISAVAHTGSRQIATTIQQRTRIAYLGARGAVVVTGAGRGLGQAAVISLVGQGYHVIATLRNLKQGDSLKAATNNPERIHLVSMDVALDESVVAGAQKIKEILQKNSLPLVGLINNAGVAFEGPVETVPTSEYIRVHNVNVVGSIRCIKALLPLLRASRHLEPRIVNISSVSGFATVPFLTPYCCSKFAIESLSDGLRREVATDDSHGVAITCIEPGYVESEMAQEMSAGGCLEAQRQVTSHGLERLYATRIADVFNFLGLMPQSPASSFGALCVHVISVARADLHTRYLLSFDSWILNISYRFLPDTILDMSMVILLFMGKIITKKRA